MKAENHPVVPVAMILLHVIPRPGYQYVACA
jgi:hypothetical protein